MPADRYVTLGLARVRTPWFTDVARWSTSGSVLVMAFLGAAMWVTFNAVWKDTSKNTEDQVKIIGTDATSQPAAP